MTISEYDTRFHELSRHAAMILPTEQKRTFCFVHGLRLQLCIKTESMASMGRSFLDVIDHTRTMEEIHRKAQGVLANSTTTMASLVGLFKQLSRTQRASNLVEVVLVQVRLQEAYILVLWAMVAILLKFILLKAAQLVSTVAPLVRGGAQGQGCKALVSAEVEASDVFIIVGLGRHEVQLERVNPSPSPSHSARESEWAKAEAVLHAATRCLRETVLIRGDETLQAMWLKFQAVLQPCPTHGMTDKVILESFYRGLGPDNRSNADQLFAGGMLHQPYEVIAELLDGMVEANKETKKKQ
ncbi:hypothetical protein MTR67_031074 [Solanum verrucosum]|uniref:Retrotransposon gag domain-containing protein n=1 Tax=Solanum verrucosum TaxID=315347 RepID=A0AAF0U1X6_SOLVR|nr:hypothetical protein MTR67_031074 [Solanum verrucosum]